MDVGGTAGAITVLMGAALRLPFLAMLGVLALGGCMPGETAQPGPVAPIASAGSPEAPGGPSYARDMGAADKAVCTAGGGTVERRGMLGMEMCVQRYADAGKACTDSTQCTGKCIGTTGGSPETGKSAGQCQQDDRLFGCYAEINGGKPAYWLCVD